MSAADPQDHTRRRRFVPALAAGVLASTVLGLGLGIGVSESCLLHGAFGTCSKKQINANRRDIDTALAQIHAQGERWTEVVNEVNQKFYLVATEMEQLTRIQHQMQKQQDEFWNATESALDILANNTKLLRQCQEYLYIRNQANHIRTTILTELGLLYTNIKTYRAALWAYRVTLLGAVAPLSNGKLPMAIIDRKSLEAILTAVGAQLLRDDERLTLAIPLSEPLAYYEAELVRQVTSTEAGLVITLAVPLTTRELVLDVYQAITLPMPNDDGKTATRWRPEAPLLAISRSHKESAMLQWHQLDQCVGTASMSICARGFATTRARDACLTTLFYHGQDAAVAACPIETVTLPQTEQAVNVGQGRWLITSQTANFEFQRLRSNGAHRTMDQVPGCRTCIITLECGTELESDRLYLKADSTSCAKTGARRLDLELSTPLAELFQLISVDDVLPQFPTLTMARAHLAERTRVQLSRPLESPDSDPDAIKKIAEPIVADFRTSAGAYHTNRGTWHLWRESVIVGTISFAISLLWQALTWQCIHTRTRLIKNLVSMPIKQKTIRRPAADGGDKPNNKAIEMQYLPLPETTPTFHNPITPTKQKNSPQKYHRSPARPTPSAPALTPIAELDSPDPKSEPTFASASTTPFTALLQTLREDMQPTSASIGVPGSVQAPSYA